MIRKLAVLLFALFALPALAAEVAGVKLDDKITLGGKEVVLNGAGIRTRAFFKVYVASLYLPAMAAVLAKGPRRIQMNLLRTLSADQLVDALLEGLAANNAPAKLAAVKPQTDELARIMKGFGEVKEGNVVTIDFVDSATRIGFNGEPKGSIGGEPFNKALTRVWLGEKPVQDDLKKAMLGG
mgnify:CR=1 FL=1